jgi:hypothetical protein
MAVAFGIPGTNANAYAGTPAMQGLLPLSYAETAARSGIACTPTAAPNYCVPNFVKWTTTPTATATLSGGAIVHASSSCSVTTATTTTLDCTAYGYYLNGWAPPAASVSIAATASNAGAALRSFNTNIAITAIGSSATAVNSGYTATGTMDSSGAARITLTGTSPNTNGTTVGVAFCGFSAFLESFLDCYKYTFSVPIFVLADHANIHTLLDTTNDTGWFVRNEWHNLAYYAVAQAVAPGGTGSCVTSSTCLQVTYHPSNGKQRAVLLLAGRAITGQDRTSIALSNWFEGANAGGVSPFEARSATLLTNKTFNDRIAVLSTN